MGQARNAVGGMGSGKKGAECHWVQLQKLISRGISKSTANLIKHLQTHKKKGIVLEKPVQISGLLNSTPRLGLGRESSSPVSTAGSSSTLHAFFKPQTVTGPETMPTRPTSSSNMSCMDDQSLASDDFDNPDSPTCLNVEVDGDNESLMPSSREVQTSALSPTSSFLSQNLSMISSDSESESRPRPTESPSPYPKAIKLRDKKQMTLEGAYDRVTKFPPNDPRAKQINS